MSDPYRDDEVVERQREDDEALDYWQQHDEDKPDPEYRA